MIYSILLFLIIALDQITKIFVSSRGAGWNVPVIDGVFSFTYAKNPGAAFSCGAGEDWAQPLFWALTLVALPLLYIAFLRLGNDRKWLKTAIIFIIGGTIGNFIERVVFGEVTDFIYVHFFANFNVADIALTIGAIMVIIWFLFLDKEAVIPIGKNRHKNG